MNEKNEFYELRSRIAQFLKSALGIEDAKSGPKEEDSEPTHLQDAPPNQTELDQDNHLGSSSSDAATFKINEINVSKYREKIERAFAVSQSATTPWIKLGLDIGTSSSKVVWRGDSDVHPVCFGGDHLSLESYLEPSLVAITGSDLFFGFEAVAKSKHPSVSNFKMCLTCVGQDASICNTDKCKLTSWPVDLFCQELKGQEIQFVNAYHLGKLIAKTKKIIISELRGTFRRKVAPKWTANLAVPETFIEQSPVADEFRRTMRIGWLMSEVFMSEPKLKSRNSLFECFMAARDLADESLGILNDDEFGCSIYPEIGAEVASIVMSRLSEEGLYAFVDIGAGTIDASFFNYYREGRKANRPPYAANVSKSLGAAQIELQASRLSPGDNLLTVPKLKKVKESYNGMTSEERKGVKRQYSAIRQILGRLSPKIQAFLQAVFREARDKKDNQLVRAKIRLVIGGGGSHLKIYRKAAIDAFTLKHATSPILPEILILRKPNDFQMPLPEEDFHRFAVAYGLSYPIDLLPEMVFPKDVAQRKSPKPFSKDYGSIYEK